MKFYAMVSNTDTYLDNAKKQYKTWKKSPKKYSKSVSDIIKIFNLKDENKFQTKKSPKSFTPFTKSPSVTPAALSGPVAAKY